MEEGKTYMLFRAGTEERTSVITATVNGLQQIKSFSDIAERRNKAVEDVCLIDF